jgi:hypothetical protein
VERTLSLLQIWLALISIFLFQSLKNVARAHFRFRRALPRLPRLVRQLRLQPEQGVRRRKHPTTMGSGNNVIKMCAGLFRVPMLHMCIAMITIFSTFGQTKLTILWKSALHPIIFAVL